MPEARAELSFGNLDNVLFELVRQAVRAEIQEISRRNEDSLFTIDQVAQRYRYPKTGSTGNSKKLSFTRNLGPRQIRFSEIGLQKWLKDKGR
jgi:hypothetical protein